LIAPVKKALLTIASAMATHRQDFVTLTQAHTITEEAFQGFSSPPGKSWLELLRFRGLLRHDPDPAHDRSNPLSAQGHVLRFPFQRFQDHLIVDSMLQHVDRPTDLFSPGGTLAFIFDGDGVKWHWRGLFGALFLYFADRYHVEFIDLLPGGAQKWWNQWDVQDAYVESVRWRSANAFTARTLELLNPLTRGAEELVALLIELAVVENHPWNAAFVDSILVPCKLPDRDAFWTCRINTAHHESGHPLSRLINWCLNAEIGSAEHETLGLALIILGWAYTSSSAFVRDTATKAMIRVFLERPLLIEPLFKRFASCDDPYVVERLFAALYGASLRTLEPERLGAHATIAWGYGFAGGQPPVHIVTRDYARGVVELAATVGCLDAAVDLVRCRPPYGAKAPIFKVTKSRVEARAKRVGADSILRSCYTGLADFGRYTLEGPVERFAAAPLAGPRPLRSADTGAAFLEDVSRKRLEIASAFERVREEHRRPRMITFRIGTLKPVTSASDVKRLRAAEKALLVLLTPEQVQRYNSEAKGWASGSEKDWVVPGRGLTQKVNAHRAKLWVANRAMALGWTQQLFPKDPPDGEQRNDHGRVERIGKKYQRIAMMELLARLADNNWVTPSWGDGPAKAYDNPLDVEFLRDIEPSILPDDMEAKLVPGVPLVPQLRCADLQRSQLKDWVTDPDLASQRLALALGADLSSTDWLTLYRYASHTTDPPVAELAWDAPPRQSDFYTLTMLLMPARTRERFVVETESHKDDLYQLPRHDFTSGPYVGELGRRSTWPEEPWSTFELRGQNAERSYSVIEPTIGYAWESRCDKSLRDGFVRRIPIPWLITSLDLCPDIGNFGIYVDRTGTPIIVSRSEDHNHCVLVRRDTLMELARRQNIEPVWTIVGEREVSTFEERSRKTVYMRYNGLCWLDEHESRTRNWSKSGEITAVKAA
jgi:hypothetical protein